MRQESTFDRQQGIYFGNPLTSQGNAPSEFGHAVGRLGGLGFDRSRHIVLGAILVVALLAFEIFNFDTTQFALEDLLGEVSFMSLRWASILAIAFCAIDFAGLAHLFTPERGRKEPKEVWYLMGAWLLGATMNALMTWWAVSLTLLSHELGNEVLSREQLLQMAPVFVAILVWLTRILFIGAFSVAGEHLFRPLAQGEDLAARPQPRMTARSRAAVTQPSIPITSDDVPSFIQNRRPAPKPAPRPVPASTERNSGRLRQRPPRPGFGRGAPAPIAARGRRR